MKILRTMILGPLTWGMLAACAGGQHAAPTAPGAATSMFQNQYVHDIYKAPAGSRVYAVKHFMYRVEHNNHVGFFPSDATFTKTKEGDLLVKDSIDPNGTLLIHGADSTIQPVAVDGSVIVKPGESLDRRFSGSARLVEVVK